MNAIKLSVTVPSLSVLTPTGQDTYSLVAKVLKLDGTPLNNANIDNVTPPSVTTTSTTFPVFIPIQNANYTVPEFEIRLFANSQSDCCFQKVNYVLNNEDDAPIVVPIEGVFLNQLGGEIVYLYEPANGNVRVVFEGSSSDSLDIAHTPNKMFLYGLAFIGQDTFLRLKEFNITLNPFTQSLSKTYDIDPNNFGAGLTAVSNTELYLANDFKVIQITISGNTATTSDVFSFAEGYGCTGDLVYDPTTQLFLIAYDNDEINDFRLGIFQRNGTIVRSAVAPVNNIFGIYQFQGVTYVMSGTGQIYTLNLSTLATTIGSDIDVTIAGSSQIQSNISIPA